MLFNLAYVECYYNIIITVYCILGSFSPVTSKLPLSPSMTFMVKDNVSY